MTSVSYPGGTVSSVAGSAAEAEREGEAEDGEVGGGAVEGLAERGARVGLCADRRRRVRVALLVEELGEECAGPRGGEADCAVGRGDRDLVAHGADGREADAEAADRAVGCAAVAGGGGCVLGGGAHAGEGLDAGAGEGRAGVGGGEQGAAVLGRHEPQEQAACGVARRRRMTARRARCGCVGGVLGELDDHPVAVVAAGVVFLEVRVLAKAGGRRRPGGDRGGADRGGAERVGRCHGLAVVAGHGVSGVSSVSSVGDSGSGPGFGSGSGSGDSSGWAARSGSGSGDASSGVEPSGSGSGRASSAASGASLTAAGSSSAVSTTDSGTTASTSEAGTSGSAGLDLGRGLRAVVVEVDTVGVDQRGVHGPVAGSGLDVGLGVGAAAVVHADHATVVGRPLVRADAEDRAHRAGHAA